MKKVSQFLTIIIAVLILVSVVPVYTSAAEEPTLNAKHALLYNMEYNTIVYEKDIDSEIYPASFTKIMTAILAFEYKSAHADIQKLTVKNSVIASAGGSGLGLKDGEVISFDDALAAVVVGGCNDATLLIADLIGGDGEGFVSMMNDKAKELGCEKTYFANPTGLHSPLMKTTLRDILKICCAAYQINDFMVLSSNFTYTVPATNMSESREVTSKNYLLNSSSKQGYYYAEAKGINAGSTPEAGYCLASVHTSGGLTALAIVSGAELIENRYRSCIDVATLFDTFQSSYKLKSVLEKGRLICEIPISLSSDIDHLILVSGDAVQFIVPGDYKDDDMRFEYTLSSKSTSAPVEQGDVYGEIQVYYKDKEIGTCPLVAQSSVERSTWLLIVSYIKGFFSNTIVKIVCFSFIGVLILLVIFMIINLVRSSRRKQSEIDKLEREYFKAQKKKNREYDEKRRARRKSLYHSLVKHEEPKKRPIAKRRPPQSSSPDNNAYLRSSGQANRPYPGKRVNSPERRNIPDPREKAQPGAEHGRVNPSDNRKRRK